VDRFGARVAREVAIDAVKRGARECLVRAAYAPNEPEPLDVAIECDGAKADGSFAPAAGFTFSTVARQGG
jgi:S-adenosylmethionine synthetase